MEIKKLHIHRNQQTNGGLRTIQSTIIFKIEDKIFKAKIVEDQEGGLPVYDVYLHNAGHVFTVRVPTAIKAHVSFDVQSLDGKNSDGLFAPARRAIDLEPIPDGNELVLKSPLAGLVVKIKAQVGQFVEKNQTLVVIESMKMENEISAPFSAFIKTLSISEGNLVKPNQVIVVFERRGESDATTKNVCDEEVFER